MPQVNAASFRRVSRASAPQTSPEILLNGSEAAVAPGLALRREEPPENPEPPDNPFPDFVRFR
ncbi:MAG TPA: hypothetical protein VFE63_08220, partial [Roseiarcus sp.]|nr:hypothetical protein [Roseiarcus sp.]